jgi:hypothetical protein
MKGENSLKFMYHHEWRLEGGGELPQQVIISQSLMETCMVGAGSREKITIRIILAEFLSWEQRKRLVKRELRRYAIGWTKEMGV